MTIEDYDKSLPHLLMVYSEELARISHKPSTAIANSTPSQGLALRVGLNVLLHAVVRLVSAKP